MHTLATHWFHACVQHMRSPESTPAVARGLARERVAWRGRISYSDSISLRLMRALAAYLASGDKGISKFGRFVYVREAAVVGSSV